MTEAHETSSEVVCSECGHRVFELTFKVSDLGVAACAECGNEPVIIVFGPPTSLEPCLGVT